MPDVFGMLFGRKNQNALPENGGIDKVETSGDVQARELNAFLKQFGKKTSYKITAEDISTFSSLIKSDPQKAFDWYNTNRDRLPPVNDLERIAIKHGYLTEEEDANFNPAILKVNQADTMYPNQGKPKK